MKAYLFTMDGTFATRKEITDFFNTLGPDIPHWIGVFPFSVFFTSRLTPPEIATKVEANFPKAAAGFYFITEVPNTAQGRLPTSVWNLVNLPELARPGDPRFVTKPPSTPSAK